MKFHQSVSNLEIRSLYSCVFYVYLYCIVSIFTPVTFCLFVCLFLQVVVGDRGTDADSTESADEGGVGRRPGRQNPDESAEHREEERVSQMNLRRMSLQSTNQSIIFSFSVFRSFQLRPTAESETLSSWASSSCPITAWLRGSSRLPESPAGRQDGRRCLPAPTATSPCAAVRGRRSLCWINCK